MRKPHRKPQGKKSIQTKLQQSDNKEPTPFLERENIKENHLSYLAKEEIKVQNSTIHQCLKSVAASQSLATRKVTHFYSYCYTSQHTCLHNDSISQNKSLSLRKQNLPKRKKMEEKKSRSTKHLVSKF